MSVNLTHVSGGGLLTVDDDTADRLIQSGSFRKAEPKKHRRKASPKPEKAPNDEE